MRTKKFIIIMINKKTNEIKVFKESYYLKENAKLTVSICKEHDKHYGFKYFTYKILGFNI